MNRSQPALPHRRCVYTCVCACIWECVWHPTPALLPGKSHGWRSLVGCSPWGRQESDTLSNFTFTFHFHALEKEMATNSSVLAWRIPGTGEPGGLTSVGPRRIGHDWSNLAAAAAVWPITSHTHNFPRNPKKASYKLRIKPALHSTEWELTDYMTA